MVMRMQKTLLDFLDENNDLDDINKYKGK